MIFYKYKIKCNSKMPRLEVQENYRSLVKYIKYTKADRLI
jgi:hypothetical protein